MDKIEKMIRCSDVSTRDRADKPIGHCRVYSRWVRIATIALSVGARAYWMGGTEQCA